MTSRPRYNMDPDSDEMTDSDEFSFTDASSSGEEEETAEATYPLRSVALQIIFISVELCIPL